MWIVYPLTPSLKFPPAPQTMPSHSKRMVVKNPLAKAGDARDGGLIPGLGRSPGRGNGNSLQYSCLEDPDGQRSLEGYSPLGCKESDMTKHACTQVLQCRASV